MKSFASDEMFAKLGSSMFQSHFFTLRSVSSSVSPPNGDRPDNLNNSKFYMHQQYEPLSLGRLKHPAILVIISGSATICQQEKYQSLTRSKATCLHNMLRILICFLGKSLKKGWRSLLLKKALSLGKMSTLPLS